MNDTGCTSHVTHDINDFIHYHEFTTPGRAKTAGKSQYIEIKGHGTVVLRVNIDGKIRQLVLTNVLYVPQASARFIAPHESLHKGHVITMDKKCLTLRANQMNGPILYKAFFNAQDCLYWLNATIMHDPLQVNKDPSGGQWLMANGFFASTSDYDLWHKRFGHPGKKSVEELPGKVKGVPDCITAPANPKPCDGCEFGKSKRAAFPSSESWTEHPLDLTHMDLVEYPVLSIDGYRYTLTTLDDHSSFGLT
jgi:hypothetical protein